MHIGIFIYPEAEVLDFAGPYEVFSTAARLCPTKAPFKVSLIARDKAPVRARAGFRVIPDYDISQHPKLDLLIIVGGVHTREMDKPEVIEWI
ncbi:MAG: DJ-1/PfpI family protein, partial [Cellvibrionaceae bacterium]|nr:DJ-1/PfpI family protein [Cellvibrionaceae bacterium]